MSRFVPLNAGCIVSVRRTRLNVLVLLTLALAGESPTCILYEIHTPQHKRSKYHTQLAKLSFDQKSSLVGLTHSSRVFFHF